MEHITEHLVLIMAGGAGTRFWPASREDKPKQFLDILGTGRSLLRQTFDRSLRITSAEQIFVITNERYRDLVMNELPGLPEGNIFCEPSRNNTAPCIAYATLKLQIRYPEAVCLVAPSDHLISDEDGFIEIARQALHYASRHDVLITLGMTPTRPDTGYGYIQYNTAQIDEGTFAVTRFTEKPDTATAAAFLASGDYLWNSGMFVWSIASILAAFDRHAAAITGVLREGVSMFYTSGEDAFLRLRYPDTENISIDYAILERASNVRVIPAQFGWSDLGTWTSLYDHLPADTEGNTAIHGPVIFDQSRGSLVHTRDGKLVAVAGLSDVVVICEDDVVLIFPKDREQEVKALRAKLAGGGLTKYL